MKRNSFLWLRILVHVLGVLPLAWIGFLALSGRLSVNPIQDIEQRLGLVAVYFLVATLSVTPLITLTGWNFLSQRRRALGLYTFLYAALHFTVFVAVDYGFDFREIGRQIVEKPFILLGVTAGFLLLLLAATSFKYFMKKMGKRWKSLHRLIYLIAPVVIIHYALAKKGNLFTLSGDVIKPALWGLLVVLLLVLRLPVVRKWFIALRQKRVNVFRRGQAQGQASFPVTPPR